jgi:hypothetical protein
MQLLTDAACAGRGAKPVPIGHDEARFTSVVLRLGSGRPNNSTGQLQRAQRLVVDSTFSRTARTLIGTPEEITSYESRQ